MIITRGIVIHRSGGPSFIFSIILPAAGGTQPPTQHVDNHLTLISQYVHHRRSTIP